MHTYTHWLVRILAVTARGHWTLRRLLLALGGTGALVFGASTPAFAHGELAQPAFLREGTITYWDVKFSIPNDATLKPGDTFTITGKFRVLHNWPRTLVDPQIAYLSLDGAGPRFLMKERYVNGVFTPDSFYVAKGTDYSFKEVVEARMPGYWHVHPMVAVGGAGPLVGPGQWVTIQDTGQPFTNLITLLNGQTIDLEKYGIGTIGIWHVILIAIALFWLAYWLLRPIVLRAKYVGTPEEKTKLVRPRDFTVGYLSAAAMGVVLLVGYFWTNAAFPVAIPLQSIRFEPPSDPGLKNPQLVSVDPRSVQVSYGPTIQLMTVRLDVKNLTKDPISVEQFNTSYVEFQNADLVSNPENPFTVEGGSTIAPGETRSLTLKMQDAVWTAQELVPINEVQLVLRGLLFFKDQASGQDQWYEMGAPINVDYKTLMVAPRGPVVR